MNKKIYYTVFDSIAKQYPNNIAIEEQNRTITYRELKEKSDQIAAHILNLNIGLSKVIAISISESIEYVATALGVMKSGNIFMPLDLKHPHERLNRIIKKTSPELLIYNEVSVVNRLIHKSISYDALLMDVVNNTLPEMSGEEPCYIISTSGSTGEPKSILGMHKSFSHFMHWESKEFEISENDRVPLIAPTTFDVSFRDIFVPLMNGATLVIPPIDIKKDIKELCKWLEEKNITLLHIVPSIFRMITKIAEKDQQYKFNNLKHVLLAGEPLYGRDVQAWRNVFGSNTELINLYGPSETTLAKIFNRLGEKQFEDNRIIPLGQPISNTAVLILNRGKLCDIGEQGEIYIKTPFRSLGYIGDTKLNGEVFVQNPLKEEADIVYKTGDMGRYLPDHSIEFIGRIDRQIKISGNRVELNEIESAFKDFEAIDDVIIIPQKDSDKNIRLCAYYTAKHEINQSELRSFLSEKLTDYMMPSYFVEMKEFPLNFNGKIDKKALPKPEDMLYEKIKFVEADSEIQKTLVQIWREIFEISRIGINNKFTDFGGNSMLAIKLIAKIYQTFGKSISIKELFEDGSIKSISDTISIDNITEISIAKAVKKEMYKLSFQQERLWILSQIEEANASYNIASAYSVKGSFDVGLFEKAINLVLNRHDVFRTSFHALNGQPFAKIQDFVDFQIDVEVSQHRNLEQTLSKESAIQFDLTQAPLCKCKVFQLSEEERILFFNIHHIVADGNSLRLLVKEINDVYKQLKNNSITEFIDDRLNYVDYAEWQQEYLKSEEAKEFHNFFRDKLNGELPILTLPTEYARTNSKSYNGSRINLALDFETTQALDSISNDLSVSKFTVFVAAMNLIFRKLAGTNDIITGTVAKNRSLSQLENMQGYFSNTLPLRVKIDREKPANEFISQVKKEILSTLDKQIYPFDKIISELDLVRDFSRNPVFDVMLMYRENVQEDLNIQGAEIQEIEIPESLSRIELAFELIEAGDDYKLEISYNSDLYSEEQVREYQKYFSEILKQISVNNTKRVKDISLLSQQETLELISNSYRKSEYSYQQNIYSLFADTATKYSDYNSLSNEDSTITYSELVSDVNKIAEFFVQDGIKEGDIVAVKSGRTGKRVAIVLALWKIGAAYLPIIDSLPQERINFILADSGARYYEENSITVPSKSSIEIAISDKMLNPAYVIYTSGTTGKPKGVKVSHASFLNQLLHQKEELKIDEKSAVLQFHEHSFDGAMVEQFLPMIAGAKSVIATKEIIEDISNIYSLCEKEQVTHAIFPPSYLSLLDISKLNSLKMIATAGDVPNIKTIQAVLDAGIEYYNLYGPTETSCTTSIQKVDHIEPEIPLGKPVYNTYMFIVDEDMQVLPQRAMGEICISGAALSLGYINNSNDDSFTKLSSLNNISVYKTGDVAKVDKNGNLVYIGRKDNRIKIRGYRLDPQEIRQEILKENSVVDVEVIAHKQQLKAFVKSSNTLDTNELKSHLATILPNYAIPEIYFVDTIPKNANNKTDFDALLKLSDFYDYQSIEDELSDFQSEVRLVLKEVLPIENIRLDDNFFKLGGHSLLAISLISKINEKFTSDVKIKDFFKNPTLRHLASIIEEASEKNIVKLKKAPVQESFELSSQQKRIYSVAKMGGDQAYNAPIAIRFENLDIELFSRALNNVIQKHPMLRARIQEHNGEPCLFIREHFEYTPEVFLVSNVNNKAITEKLVDKLSTDYLNISDYPLFKISFIKDEFQNSVMILNIHHVIADGISLNIFVKDLTKEYNHLKSNVVTVERKENYIYLDYIYNQQYEVELERNKTAREYWKNKLQGELTVLDLPTKTVRSQVQTYNGLVVHSTIDKRNLNKLNRIAGELGVSKFSMAVALVKILLRRYTGQNDIILGTAVSGREYKEYEDIIGLFSNIIPLRDNIEKSDTLVNIIEKVSKTINESFEYQAYPFEKMIEDLALERDMSRGAIFDFAMTYGYKDEAQFEFDGVKAEYLQNKGYYSKFDILFSFIESDNKLDLELTYNTDLYEDKFIASISGHLEQIIEEITISINQPVDSINILTQNELDQLLKFNKTEYKYSDNSSITDYVDQIAEKYPENTALTLKDKSISYKELKKRSDVIAANILKNNDIRIGDNVAVFTKRDIDFVPIMLGVMKTGAIYVPIDEETPLIRLKKILNNCSAKMLITDKIIDVDVQVVDKNNLINTDISMIQLAKLESKTPAYIIYSSGTTGEPKGIVATHSNLINTIEDQIHAFEIDTNSKVMQFYSTAFDASMLEVYLALFAGAELVVTPKEIISDKTMIESYLQEKQVSFAFFPPSYLKILDKEKLANVKTIVTGMEPPILEDASYFAEKGNYFNIYGPTETTVICSYHKVDPRENNNSAIPIGKPMRNYSMYIMNDELQIQPIGFPGEICIEGEGLALGYLNDKDLTDSKFKINPLTGHRIFCSGDIGKMLPNGDIVYLSRKDKQVKIRGYRIETGEIKANIDKIDGIRESYINVIDENGNKELAAYAISNSLKESEIRQRLKSMLPQYMIPKYIKLIDVMPLTLNGKIDKNALPTDFSDEIDNKHENQELNEKESMVLEIWKNVLAKEVIGINRNFFELGGDSIKAIQICSLLAQKGYLANVRDVFSHNTIKDLASVLKAKETRIEQDLEPGIYPLSPIQKWFIDQNHGIVDHFNQAQCYEFTSKIDSAKFKEAIDFVMKRHSAFRTKYIKTENGYAQELMESPTEYKYFEVLEQKFDKDNILSISEEMNKSMNPQKGEMIKFKIIREENVDYLIIVAHHFIIDGVSWRILTQELETAYKALESGSKISLPEESDSFQIWTQNIESVFSSKKPNIEYWNKFETNEYIVEFQQKETKFYTASFELDQEYTRKLLEDCNKAFSTEINDVLLTAVNIGFADMFPKHNHIDIMLESHGREHDFKNINISDTIGWFTTFYPVSFSVKSNLKESIVEVKDKLRSVPNKGFDFIALKYISNELKHIKEPKITFNYLGIFNEVGESSLLKIKDIEMYSVMSGDISFHQDFVINAVVENGKFKLFLDSKYNKQVSEQLSGFIKQQLIKTIDFLSSYEEQEITKTDIDFDGFESDELDDFLNTL